MTEGPNNTASLISRMAGKWQIPLLLLGVVACGIAAVTLIVTRDAFDWDREFHRQVQRVEQVVDGDYTGVDKDVREFLAPSVTPPAESDRRGRVHELLGEILWRNIQQNDWVQPRHWEGLREHYALALRYGRPKTAEIVRRLGEAAAGLDKPGEAVDRFKEAAEIDSARSNEMYRRVIELRRDMPDVSDEQRLGELARYIDSEEADAERFGLALDESVSVMIHAEDFDRAGKLIDMQQARGLGDAYDRNLLFQRARLLAAKGLTEQADSMLIHLTGKLEPASPLYLRSLLLRGQLIWDENPAEAEHVFREILTRAANSPMAVAATVGLAKAYGQMRLYDKAVGEYEQAVEALRTGGANPYVDPAELHDGLIDGHDALLAAAKPAAALRFAQLERKFVASGGVKLDDEANLALMGRLAAGYMAVARQMESDQQAAVDQLADESVILDLRLQLRENLEGGGDALLEMATLASLRDDQAHGDSLWAAAEAFDKAGLRDKNISTLEAFITGRPGDERLPEARFSLGQALQAAGRYDDAITIYKDNLAARVPASRHLKAVEGLIPMAQCYIAKGPEHFEQAEKILHDVTAGHEGVTPESALYRQALYGLGRLYYLQGKWRLARRSLTEAVLRDPGKPVPAAQSDPQGLRDRYIRATQSKFFIAKSYQHSARQLRKLALETQLPKRQTMRKAADAQLAQAAELHGEVVDRLEVLDGELELTEKALRQSSYFDRADCLFDLGQYDEALRRYEKAVFLFQRSPQALGGLVAIYNCHVAGGRPGQANAAMERARELLKHVQWKDGDLPAAQPTAEDWDRWWRAVAYLEPEVGGEE